MKYNKGDIVRIIRNDGEVTHCFHPGALVEVDSEKLEYYKGKAVVTLRGHNRNGTSCPQSVLVEDFEVVVTRVDVDVPEIDESQITELDFRIGDKVELVSKSPVGCFFDVGQVLEVSGGEHHKDRVLGVKDSTGLSQVVEKSQVVPFKDRKKYSCDDCAHSSERIDSLACKGCFGKNNHVNWEPKKADDGLAVEVKGYFVEETKQVGGSHYQGVAIEPINFIVKNGMGYREGNVVKYVFRHKKKNGAEDIKKAIHYLEMILEDYNEL